MDGFVEPILARDGSTFDFCGRRYDARRGTFLGRATSESLVLSRDGTRSVSVETAAGRRAVVVRKLPSLEIESRVSFDGLDHHRVAFLADGRAILLASHPCRTVKTGPSSTKTTCQGRGVFEVRRDGLVSLGPAFTAIAEMAVSADGGRAFLVRADGAREIVSLPDGARIAALSRTSADPFETEVALDRTGRRLAYADASGVHVAELLEGSVVSLRDEPDEPEARGAYAGIAFADDGSVLSWDIDAVRVFREGASSSSSKRRAAAIELGLDVPEGFHAARFRNGPFGRELSFSDFERESASARSSVIAAFRRDDRGDDDRGRRARRRRHVPRAEVWVSVTDPTEFVGKNLDAWAQSILRAQSGEPLLLRAWGDDGARSVELAIFDRVGCDPIDAYVRFTERDGALVRVRVEVPAGTARRDVPLDALSAADGRGDGPARAAVVPPPTRRGPC
ncbi:MAG: hypothetical protein KF819_09225 [Labilithrix sp.]|nr:hypothetical protein [Labilithrix sp.]